MTGSYPREVLTRAWQDGCREVCEAAPSEVGGVALEHAMALVALARQYTGVACDRCAGFGDHAYEDAPAQPSAGGYTIRLCEKCQGRGYGTGP